MDIQRYQDIQRITTEILVLKQQTAVNIVEIGRRLIQAKEMLPHGQWGRWLEKEVEFSDRTARNFMRAAREFSNWQAISDLPPTKIFALLDVPADEREQFIHKPHQLPTGETKTVSEMTTRELQEAIKARKAAEKAALEAQARAEEAERKLAELQSKPKPEPQIIERVVVPPEIQRQLSEAKMTARELAKVAAENKRLKFELEAAKNRHEYDQLNMEAKVSTFAGRIRLFLRDMAPLGYLGQEVIRATPAAQKEYEAAIAALEAWCRDMRDIMLKPKESKIIDAEVIQ